MRTWRVKVSVRNIGAIGVASDYRVYDVQAATWQDALDRAREQLYANQATDPVEYMLATHIGTQVNGVMVVEPTMDLATRKGLPW